MKKIVLTSALVLALSIGASAQVIIEGVDINKIDSIEYVEILGYDGGLFQSKLNIIIDYGQKFKIGSDMRIQNAEGKAQRFNTMIHAMNFMYLNGWDFVTSYAISSGSTNVYHWLMKRAKN
jgi:hypothetical protein